jgi:predicted RNA-binding protein with PIN domain
MGLSAPLYIIDGYNVILNRKAFRQGRSVNESREYFTRLLDAYASKKKVEITVVWDGTGNPSGNQKGGRRIKSVYSNPYQNADEKIVRLVERMQNRRRATVVTDDRRHIVGIVKSLGARSMKVKDFLDMIGYYRKKSVSGRASVGNGQNDVSKDEKRIENDLSVEEWLNLFQSGKK